MTEHFITQLNLTDRQLEVLAVICRVAHSYKCMGFEEQLKSVELLLKCPDGPFHELISTVGNLLTPLIERRKDAGAK